MARLARALAGDLFPEYAQEKLRAWKSVILVGADLLENVPFECLPLEDGKPLGIARATSRLPSLPVGVWLSRRSVGPRPSTELDAVLLAAPETRGSDRPRLDLGDQDEERLLAPFARDRVAVRAGSRASASELAATTARGSRMLIVFTHGVYDVTRSLDGERPAGLEVTPEPGHGDGILGCVDVERMVSPPMVVLLACGTERGPSRLGDDIGAHLGGAFFTARAETVVASRCDIPPASTIELAGAFVERLRTFGDAPDEAMRRARETVRHQPGTSDPYYWGLVTVEGLAGRPLFEPAPPPSRSATPVWCWTGALAFLVLAGGLGLIASRRRRTRINPGT
jgi:CHAT domain-containing protein